jgi:hypothetical protein
MNSFIFLAYQTLLELYYNLDCKGNEARRCQILPESTKNILCLMSSKGDGQLSKDAKI